MTSTTLIIQPVIHHPQVEIEPPELFLREVSNRERVQLLDKTVRSWKNISMDRLGNIRQDPVLFPKDRETVESYKDLLGMFNMFEDNGTNKRIQVVQDKSERIQGVCTFTINRGSLYINQLFTAPWNLKMHAPNDEEYAGCTKRGVGTILIANCYMIAQERRLKRLELKPLDGSLTYYTDVIKMEEDKEEKTLFYTVIDIGLPKGLQTQLDRA
jgi:hypothetical protein